MYIYIIFQAISKYGKIEIGIRLGCFLDLIEYTFLLCDSTVGCANVY